ncbi:MAG TPA: hypothetical protein VIN72_08070 [Lutibacter sp.]
MEKKFEFNFSKSLGILFKTYYGPITIEDIESSWNYAFENGLIPKVKKGFILDYRNSNFNMKIEDHTMIVNFYQKHIDIFGNYKIAILTENPKDIVIPILVESKDEGYRSRPFSTLEAAIAWILS